MTLPAFAIVGGYGVAAWQYGAWGLIVGALHLVGLALFLPRRASMRPHWRRQAGSKLARDAGKPGDGGRQ